MKIGMIGLGRMGGNITRRLLRAGHEVAAYDPVPSAVATVAEEGAVGTASLEELVAALAPPRALWLMVPAGEPTEDTLARLGDLLDAGDTVIDGGNSYYRDSMRRATMLADKGITLLDAGTSGGVWGLTEGYCLMIGGDEAAFLRLETVFQTLAPSPEHGYARVGPSGAGHFVKMVHNGIEYGLMQAYAEGFELMQAKEEFNLDLAEISELWRYGSVVRSWLLDLSASALKDDPELSGLASWVADSGEGRWTTEEAIELGVPLPVITLALQARFRSRQAEPFSGKLLAAMRQKFGGHAVKPAE
ncbi:6-phosphogluconate dehydrogenase, decarboxylating [Dehalogenimonas lykanthroporepellens BL-DC-9]|nr:6-phosphogluconate dehydrogenase, decarboxylating [Dehalogenimonas lykanthroporepellens BL-DC-9]